ncbi:Translation initiation factor IF6 [mine drainage metagenome]|uniref:Translation initiation factor IF6 n=2 Tax=mine drainage metagenome TaxID=410659 RepID=T1AA73_9ZZZZ
MIEKFSALSSDFIGVYIRTFDDITYIPSPMDARAETEVQRILGTETRRIMLANSYLVGSMMTGNSNGLILSGMADPSDIREDSNGRNILILGDKVNAIGNDVVANDRAAIIHRGFSKSSVKKIEDCLGVEVIKTSIGGSKTVGSVSILTKKGMLVTPTVSEEELEFLSNFFKVEAKPGTANFGSMYLGSSIVANATGVLVGTKSTPIEIGRIDEVLS